MPFGSWAPTIAAALDRIRVYRNAAISSGSAGTWTQIAFDATSSELTTIGMSLSGGKMVVATDGDYYIESSARWTGLLLLTGVEIRIVRELAGGGESIVVENRSGGISALAVDQIGISGMVTLTIGDAIRIDVRSIGVGGIAITTGDDFTFAHSIKV